MSKDFDELMEFFGIQRGVDEIDDLLDAIEEENKKNQLLENEDEEELDGMEGLTPMEGASAGDEEIEGRALEPMGPSDESANAAELDELQNTHTGSHIEVDDQKFVNDPKLMAEAVRTMMNKEDE